jgi:hypothetical protein
LETVECDLCVGSQTTGYLRIAPYQFKRDPHYILVKCSSCKLVFLNPRPGPDLIGSYYGSDYYAHAGMNNRKPNLKARLRNRFLDGLGGYDRSSLSGRLIRSIAPRSAVDIIFPSQRKGELLEVTSQQSVLMTKSRDGGEDCSAGTSAVWQLCRDALQMTKKPLLVGGLMVGFG